MRQKRYFYRFLGPLLAALVLSGVSMMDAAPPSTGKPANNSTSRPLTAIVADANRYANAEDFSRAIPLYEEAVRLAPTEKTLKNNLAVIYFNYGVQLQRQKHYEDANRNFDKSLALQPDKMVVKAKAASYYYQGLELRDSGTQDFSAVKALLNKAIALDAQEFAFKKALASVLLEEARGRIDQGKLEEGVTLLEEARSFDPDGDALKQSLINIQLKLAKDHPEQRQQWLDKVTALDHSPETLAKIEIVKAPVAQIAGGAAPALSGSTSQVQHAPTKLSAETLKLSVSQMLTDIEKQLELQPSEGLTLKDRLEAAEVQVYGTPQVSPEKGGALNVRVKKLYTTLFGGGEGKPADQGSNTALSQEPVETSQYSYLDRVFKVTEGRVIRWGKFPLRVYIDEPKNNPRFKPEYVKTVKEALEDWKVGTRNFVTYVVVNSRTAADVQVDWADTYTDRFADMEETPDYYKKYTVPKQSPLVKVLSLASSLAPGYYGIAPQAVGAALQYRQMQQMQTIIDESKITLGLSALDGLPPEEASMMLKNMVAHEYGHVLGLKAHSTEEGDLMYPVIKTAEAAKPSVRDVETLRQIYNRPANIVLNMR